MKMFLIDEKHGLILNELNLDNMDVQTAKNIIEFLKKSKITDRYKNLVIGNIASYSYENGERFVEVN